MSDAKLRRAHAALGRTTGTAHVLVDRLAGRQSLYVAMSRGRKANFAYCITQSPRLADISEGTRRAPELGRAARLDHERAGLPPPAGRGRQRAATFAYSSPCGAAHGGRAPGPVLDPPGRPPRTPQLPGNRRRHSRTPTPHQNRSNPLDTAPLLQG